MSAGVKQRRKELELSIKRLTTLLDVFKSAKKVKNGHLLTLPTGNILFDIGNWVRPITHDYAKGHDIEPKDRDRLKNQHHCNTAACVAGTAASIPEFRKLGFRTRDLNVHFKEQHSEEAFARFFGIRLDMAEEICLPHLYDDGHGNDIDDIQPKHVVPKLKAAIKAQQKLLKELG